MKPIVIPKPQATKSSEPENKVSVLLTLKAVHQLVEHVVITCPYGNEDQKRKYLEYFQMLIDENHPGLPLVWKFTSVSEDLSDSGI